MNKDIDKSHIASHSEHGTTGSYIVGFLLSLILTFIPYYLVVQKILTGNALLVSILIIAILQMIVQIVFFLHLGRGPKPFYNVVFFIATVGLIVVVVGASLFIMSHLYHNMSPQEVTKRLAQEENIAQIGGEETGACKETYENHTVTITNSRVLPMQTTARRCDTLTIINEDNKEREMAFGSHPSHDNYGGISELIISGRPETITLNQEGEFIFHDHKEPVVTGYFTVRQ